MSDLMGARLATFLENSFVVAWELSFVASLFSIVVSFYLKFKR